MSIATLARTLRAMTPEDELIGSLSRERVSLAVRYAGAQSVEGTEEAKHWLAYALNADIPLSFHTLAMAFERREHLEDCDLEFWYDESESNRERLQAKADESIDYCVRYLSNQLCSQLGVTA